MCFKSIIPSSLGRTVCFWLTQSHPQRVSLLPSSPISEIYSFTHSVSVVCVASYLPLSRISSHSTTGGGCMCNKNSIIIHSIQFDCTSDHDHPPLVHSSSSDVV